MKRYIYISCYHNILEDKDESFYIFCSKEDVENYKNKYICRPDFPEYKDYTLKNYYWNNSEKIVLFYQYKLGPIGFYDIYKDSIRKRIKTVNTISFFLKTKKIERPSELDYSNVERYIF